MLIVSRVSEQASYNGVWFSPSSGNLGLGNPGVLLESITFHSFLWMKINGMSPTLVTDNGFSQNLLSQTKDSSELWFTSKDSLVVWLHIVDADTTLLLGRFF